MRNVARRRQTKSYWRALWKLLFCVFLALLNVEQCMQRMHTHTHTLYRREQKINNVLCSHVNNESLGWRFSVAEWMYENKSLRCEQTSLMFLIFPCCCCHCFSSFFFVCSSDNCIFLLFIFVFFSLSHYLFTFRMLSAFQLNFSHSTRFHEICFTWLLHFQQKGSV